MRKAIQFFLHGVWNIQIKGMPPLKAFGVRILRIISLTLNVFKNYQLQRSASALTYYTLLGIVPMLVLLLGVSRGFFFEDTLVTILLEKFSNQKELSQYLTEFAKATLTESKTGLVAGVSFAILIWSLIKILTQVEIAVNEMWEVKKTRSMMRKFSDYLAMMLFSPFLFLIANGLTLFLSAKIATLTQNSVFFQEISPAVFLLSNIFPYFLITALFTFLYIFMPNTRVGFKPALYAGLIASAAYQILQVIYVVFQVGVTRYNSIYGTFAAVPLFLTWVHLSWVILLMGAKMSFAFQNVDAYEFVTEGFKLSRRFETILSLRIVHYVIKAFLKEKFSPTPVKISHDLAIPLVLTQNIISQLVESKVLVEVKHEDEEFGVQPAVDPHQLTIKRVLDMIDTRGETIPMPRSHELEVILKSLEEFSSVIKRSKANMPLKDIE
jgi:membrane protein